MSYWQGVHGKDPMRYSGGLLGGSWLTALTSDLGNGRFDGTGLILNFDMLNPANWLWGKQYEVYTHIDTGAERYLEFEKWSGDFIELSDDELQFLVDNLFIGDKLTRNELKSHDGTIFDLRNITSPITVFTSSEDNISPAPQALGWILDLYRDVDDIRTAGRTILYCLSHKIGHLAIFVSTKAGAKQEFVQMMDVIDCLPPGLHEMVISPRPATCRRAGSSPETGSHASSSGRWTTSVRLDATAPRTTAPSLPWLGFLKSTCHSTAPSCSPLSVRSPTSRRPNLARNLDPLGLSYTLFADKNPWVRPVQKLAAEAAARKLVPSDNPFLALQAEISRQVTASLDAYRVVRYQLFEQMFFAFYGSPVVQALLGINTESEVRPVPGLSSEDVTVREAKAEAYEAMLKTGGFDEALIRAVLYVMVVERTIDQRCALALNVARQRLMHLSLAQFKVLVWDQFFVLQLEPVRAVEALASLVPGRRAQGPAETVERDRGRWQLFARGWTRSASARGAGARRAG